ncbi:MAG TPA: EAL domain-containing protein [Acetobacteraceae bacterium]
MMPSYQPGVKTTLTVLPRNGDRLLDQAGHAVPRVPTSPEGFDARIVAISRAAAALFAAPAAFVSLLDRGIPGMPIASSGPWQRLGEALSGSSILSSLLDAPGSTMVVDNAARDPRFAGLPLGAGPDQARFFILAKLLDGDRRLMGVLCVVDHACGDQRTGPLSQARLDQLASLADAAAAVLELRRTEAALHHRATHDPLTGLPNRALLQSRVADAIGPAEPRRCAMLTIDLGRFSQVTDLAGHAGGEALVQQAAQRLRAMTTVRSVLGRLSGDEFGFLVPGAGGGNAAQAMADEVLDLLARPFVIDGVPILINPSIGIACCPDDAACADTLMRRSADALYWAKRRGRNQSYRFDAGLQRQVMDRHLVERELRSALAGNAFTLDWQPFVATRTGQLLGFEALLRWSRPGHGPMAPDDFRKVADACGLGPAIDRWTLEAACRAAVVWPEGHLVSVNLSAGCLCRTGLQEMVVQALRDSGLAPECLQLEVGSRAFAAPGRDAVAQAAALRRLGVRLALNDFGAGCFVLSQKSDLPFDKFKINRLLLQGIGMSGRAALVVKAALQLGRALGATLCATGLETAEEYAFLLAHGCDEMQGTYVAMPGSVAVDPGFGRAALLVELKVNGMRDPLGAMRGLAAAAAASSVLWFGAMQLIRLLH